ncbi:MAG TPA: PPC domain-containing protein [Aggregatilineales bacterium]|nr:PPC domain-containing protein [Aggregatilineales bacterium]
MRVFLFIVLLSALTACNLNQPPPTAPVLTQLIDYWVPVQGQLSAGETQGWRFAGSAGDAIRLRALSNAASLTLSLVEPGGSMLQTGSEITVTLPSTGAYTVLVTSSETGQYELGLSYTDRPNPADVTNTPIPVTVAVPTPTPPYYAELGEFIGLASSGSQINGTLDQVDTRHIYTIEGRANLYLTASLRRASGSVDPVLSLFAPGGLELAADDNSGGNRTAILRGIRLPENGTYSLRISGDGFTGDYQLSVELSSTEPVVTPVVTIIPTATPITEILTPTIGPAQNQTLIDHIPVLGVVTRPGDLTRYIIDAFAGDRLTIGVSLPVDSALRPQIEVYDPDGVLVSVADVVSSNAGGDLLVTALPISMTGPVQVLLRGEGDTIGGYVISFGRGTSRQEVRRGAAADNQPYNAIIEKRGIRDSWSLFLNAGDVISAAASPADLTFDPLLTLTGPDGVTLITDDSGGGGKAAQIASIAVPVSGLYHLKVVDSSGLNAGAYTLIWRFISRNPTPTPPPPSVMIASFDDSVEEGGYRYYPFQSVAGARIRLRVIAQPGTNLDSVAALLDSNGQVIAEDDDSGGNLNPYLEVVLPADGTYTVRINGYLSSGDYVLTIERLY